MLLVIGIVFVVGYFVIALEHPLKIDKAAAALLTGVLCWALYSFGVDELVTTESIPQWFIDKVHDPNASHSAIELKREWLVEGQLSHYVSEIAGILFFLMGAMTIVELVDAFEGFSLITSRIKTRNRSSLVWLLCTLTFFMSSVLDNLTTTIVMVSLVKKLTDDQVERMTMAGLIVIAANAGGAWTVIGDVTTTMLWIKNRLDTVGVMRDLFLPSLACLILPVLVTNWRSKNKALSASAEMQGNHRARVQPAQQRIMLFMGTAGLISVPIFKAVFHLPPFTGMMLALSAVWIVAEFLRHGLIDLDIRTSTHVVEVLRRIDLSSVLFFLGILLAVGALGATGILTRAAEQLAETLPNRVGVAILIGLISAVVDNVPLVAAGIEMYSDPKGHWFWTLLAYCAGTGGSCLIIGSAAGVAAMGLEKISFFWYFRKISFLATLGYFAGIAVYLAQVYLSGNWSQLN